MNRNPYQWIFTPYPNINLHQGVLTNYQNMGFSRNLVLQAWNECQGNQNLLLDTLLRLSGRPQQRNQNLRIKRIPNSTILKKMPIMKYVNLKFEGDTALEYLELRKLGLFSKKAFRNAQSLHLEYNESRQALKDKHIEILANHMNRGLRKLKHLSVKLQFDRGSSVDMRPLLKSIKQTFVGLVSLRLSLGKVFEFSAWDLYSFERLFLKMRSTLKYLDLDFSRNPQYDRNYFSEALCAVIMSGLPRLEGLCLNFGHTSFSTRIVGQLLYGASTHLTRLSRLYINLERCTLDQAQWNLYQKKGRRRFKRFSNNLQDLKLNFDGCFDLSLEFLSLLQSDIVTFCPKLKRLFICTLNCTRYSNGFYASLEKEFLQRLRLKWLRLLYSYDMDETEKNLERYQKMQLLEMGQTLVIQKKFEKIKQIARGEEEVGLYFKTLIEEEQAPIEHELDEQEYLQKMVIEEEMDQLNELDRHQRKIEIAEQNRVQQHIGDYIEMTEEDNLFLSSDPQEESYEEDDIIGEAFDIIVDIITDDIQKELDLQDHAEAEIRFRDLTQGGRVTQISLDYGDSYPKKLTSFLF